MVTRAPQPPAESFASAGLPPRLVDELRRAGLSTPFPIQAATLPDALAGNDLLGRAATGSGKTLGFGLPLLARLAAGRRTPRRPRGLVLVPTRELACQVSDVLQPLGRVIDVRVTAVYGGTPLGRQIDRLAKGVDVLVATPGRLVDLLERGAVFLDAVETVVLDEADHLCDLGFLPVVRRLLDLVPVGGQRLLFSATLDGDVDTLVRAYLTDPVAVAVEPVPSLVDAEPVDFQVIDVARREDKAAITADLLTDGGSHLLFVRTKHGADRFVKQLARIGVDARALHGGMTQSARSRALSDFAAGSVSTLVATDVAARGLHVDGVTLVVHVDPPAEAKTFAHRSGRTGRAGAGGTVVSLALPEERRGVEQLHAGAARAS